MKKNLLMPAVCLLGILQAQIRTSNVANNISVVNSPAFIDASSNTAVNSSTNVGKGLVFPRVDLTAMTSFPSVTTGIPNAFPTHFDGMIVYNTSVSGTAGIGTTSGTLTPGFWYYENKSSTNNGGTWKALSTPAVSSGDNLGNHSATQNVALNDYELRLRGVSDNNQSLVYNSTVNGPRLFGANGGYLGTSNGTNALTWDGNGNLYSPGKLRVGANGAVNISTGNNGISGGVEFIKGDGSTRIGYIGFDNTNISYTSENGANHIFNGEINSGVNNLFKIRGNNNGIYWDTNGGGFFMDENTTMKMYNNKNLYSGGNGTFNNLRAGVGSNGFIQLSSGGSSNSGYLEIFNSASVSLGYIGYHNSDLTYVAKNGSRHVFSGEIYSGVNQWFRVRGNTGIYWEDYGGGLYMSDNDWLRVRNNKNIYTGGVGRFDTRIETARVQGTSDRRFKRDLAPIMDATAKLNLLNGYTYTWRDKKEFPGQALGEGKDMGVIAQEVEKVFPDAVMTNKEGYKSVNYNALIPVLIEALKETNNRVHVLEAQLDKMQQAGTQVTAAKLKRK